MSFNRKEYFRKYSREWVAKRRAEFFKDRSCSNCSSIIDLQLHHLDPKLKISHSIWSWSEVRRNIEIAKCIILCKKCHKDMHKPPLIHGTCGGYRTWKCRCILYKEWSREDRAKWRVLKKITYSIVVVSHRQYEG